MNRPVSSVLSEKAMAWTDEIDGAPARLQRGEAGFHRRLVHHVDIDEEIRSDRCGKRFDRLPKASPW